MNTRKRFYLILVALIVLLTSILPTTVMGQTVDEKADALNHLSILASAPQKILILQSDSQGLMLPHL